MQHLPKPSQHPPARASQAASEPHVSHRLLYRGTARPSSVVLPWDAVSSLASVSHLCDENKPLSRSCNQADGIESAQKEVKVKGATRETLAFLMVLGELTRPHFIMLQHSVMAAN